MFSRKIAAIGLGFAGLVVGVALGWGLASRRASAIGATGAVLAEEAVAASHQSRQVRLRNSTECASDREKARDIEVLRGLEKMQWLAHHRQQWEEIERQMPRRVFHFATGELSSEFVAAFGVSVAEGDLLEGAIAQALDRLSDRMAAGARVEVAPDQSSARVVVPRLGDAGGAIYDELVGVFRKTLGAERMSYFNVLVGECFDEELRRYGAEDLVYAIQRAVDDQGRVRIVIEEERLSLSTGQPARHRRFEYFGSTTPDSSADVPVLRKVIPMDLFERMRNR